MNEEYGYTTPASHSMMVDEKPRWGDIVMGFALFGIGFITGLIVG